MNNADCYALPVKAAPASMKYLRVRRMDTKEEVIIGDACADDDEVPSPSRSSAATIGSTATCLLGIVDRASSA